jgi:tripartite-type tricarboxylate transporter receptor subunit TctC
MKKLQQLISIILLSFASISLAQNYPNKPIKIYVGYGAGGAVDLVARSLAKSLTTSLNQTIIVENKPGAGANIATKQTIESPADGYTLMLAANALSANMALYKPQPYNVDTDLIPISLVGHVPVVLATTVGGKYQSLKDLIVAAKSQPDLITYGSPGNGATPHMAVKFFEQASGISLKHVPYKGGPPAITDLIGGQIDLVAMNLLEVAPQVKSGKLKIIAIMSKKRSLIFPEVPTVAESGFPGFEAAVWYGIVAPIKTPETVVELLYAEIQKSLATPDMKERLASVGGEVTPLPRSEFINLLKSEFKRYDKLVREANIHPD